MTFAVTPDVIYKTWLNSKGHSQMTGAIARCSKRTGGKFTAWDGYISGKNLRLVENKLIVQSWRSTEFRREDKDSKLTIKLKSTKNGTELSLSHTDIPKGQTQYRKGWKEYYFAPMKSFFG